MASLPNVADTAEPSELVKDFLQRYRGILAQRWPGWAPGVEWNLSEMTALEARLEARCEPAPKTATYASVCRRSAISCFCVFFLNVFHPQPSLRAGARMATIAIATPCRRLTCPLDSGNRK